MWRGVTLYTSTAAPNCLRAIEKPLFNNNVVIPEDLSEGWGGVDCCKLEGGYTDYAG
jgi:hypothetical protein